MAKPASGTALNTALSISSGLVACFPANEGTGTTLTDKSATANNGTLSSSAIWGTDSTYAQALSFSGSTAISFPHASAINIETYTIAFAIKTTQSTFGMILIKQATTGSGHYPYGVYINDGASGALQLQINGSTAPETSASGNIRDGSWHKVIITRAQGGAMTAYVDGTSVGTATDNATSGSSVVVEVVSMGAGTNGASHFTGSIGYYYLWNRVLTSTERTALATDEFAMFAAIAAPTSIYGTSGNGKVTLGGTLNASSDPVNIYQSSTEGATGTLIATSVTLPRDIAGLTNGTPYYFTLRSNNGSSLSLPSNEVAIAPAAPTASGRASGSRRMCAGVS